LPSAVAKTIQFLKKKSGFEALTGSNRIDCSGSSHERYREERIIHWDRVSSRKDDSRRIGAFYHRLIKHYYRLLIPENSKILEIGCSHGDLLAALQPSFGVGIDLSGNMIRRARNKYANLHFIRADAHDFKLRGSFDIIILSDLINDLWDVQAVLENIKSICHPGTRLIINFYNNLWRIPLGFVGQMKLGAEMLEQNWFSPNDINNLLRLSDFETIRRQPAILIPLNLPFVANFANRYLARLVPFSWFDLTNFVVARPLLKKSALTDKDTQSVSVIIPARNEAGNIEEILERVPQMGSETELIFVEGHSDDNTYEHIERMVVSYPQKKCRLYRQQGKGKGDAVRLGFEKAQGDVLMILDADMTVPPEDLPRFYQALIEGKGEFINGVRLVYPLENQSMRFFNILGNKFFSLAFSWLLDQPIKDTLCGTKVLTKRHYRLIANNRHHFGEFDPFGDFDLLFGAARMNLKIVEMPIRYRARTYGSTNIDRWRHGVLLLKMVVFAAKRLKFI
jgi:SAM-dependent methyltransferase